MSSSPDTWGHCVSLVNKREVQVNIRLTAREKIIIDELARRAGFRSISDYLRTAGLRQAS